MRLFTNFLCVLLIFEGSTNRISGQIDPSQIQFVRQGVKRLIFSEDQSIPLAQLDPKAIVGMASMHPHTYYSGGTAEISLTEDQLIVSDTGASELKIWFGGFNPFATYMINLAETPGEGQIGFEFSDSPGNDRFIIGISFKENRLLDATLRVVKEGKDIVDKSILTELPLGAVFPGKIILQMLGSGLNLLLQTSGIPIFIGQEDFNSFIDLREQKYLHSLQSNLYLKLDQSRAKISFIESGLTTGLGQADIRAITYKDGSPLLDQGRLWYTISIRGRALPHHIQGVFSMDPSVFDLHLEGIIVFDRNDGILRNEISSHIFYDPAKDLWQGLTTGFTAYANPGEKKQILAIESKKDPRFGFSIMKARPTGIVGDIEDSHILFDEEAQKWRLLTCENHNGYKAVILESDTWDQGYIRIAGPVEENSTGTSIQKIGEQRFCFSGSSAREIFIYTYPDLVKVGTLKMDLPPWDDSSGTRVWPNVVVLPEGYPSPYVALMMDRYNYPGQQGPHWSYGAVYLYFGYLAD